VDTSPPESPPERASPGRGIVAVVAFLFLLGGAVTAWRAFGPGSNAPATGGASASASQGGYYVSFPPDADRGEGAFSAQVTAATNLPNGTLVSISTTDEGTCCPAVKDGTIAVTTSDGSCYALVGAAGSSSGFTVTITAKPDFLPWVVIGPGPGNTNPPQQPASVLAILGQHFENLSGDQVVTQPDGSKWLVATADFTWPSPRCGGDPLPLFGGVDCQPQQEQLQGDDLAGAMTDIMGTITQARMCEFWGIELPPSVEAQHPWPAFAKQWRDWFLNPPKDFSDAQSNSGWTEEPVTWRLVRQQGDRYFVDITDHDTVIISLEVDRLPDYCPTCDRNVVPFWGVVDWTLR
jgi:hypothetical protein